MTLTKQLTKTIDRPVLNPETAIYDQEIPARQPWSRIIQKGQILRIIDLQGNQAVDTLFYRADDPSERYSAQDTMVNQGNIFITTGTVIADECGRHDTVGGACSMESNSVRYGLHKKHLHACVENYLIELSKYEMNKRDLVSNINFYMNVPVSADGTLEIIDGLSEAGKIVELRAEMDVMVLISNCPQVNNPCNAYNPTPIRLIVWDTVA
jgi:urea carboxylase-associated protein 1